MALAMTSHTCSLDPRQGRQLHRWLKDRDWAFRDVPYARFAARKDKANVVFYESGKLVVQGKQTREFVEFVLEPEILKEARLGYEAVKDPSIFDPRLGVDESGKGDFFGPMCTAGVYANEPVIRRWREVGVRDSKTVKTDRRISELAKTIRETPGCVFRVVTMGNEAYNRLFRSMRSVNRMLAWGHARAIENLLLQKHCMDPWPVRAISDQFAAHKETVGKALMSLGREIELIQRHKAESDLVVAAASILARDEFVTRLGKLEREYEMRLPRGASKAVDEAAREFVERYGAEKLTLVAKTHFRTANRAQGLPEPPKRAWRPSKRHGATSG